MTSDTEDLKTAVIQTRNLCTPGWEERSKRERHEKANAAMEKLQRRIRVAHQLNLPLPSISEAFAEGFTRAGQNEESQECGQ